eukprot:TRINITY_DN10270_c0_g1_i2.p1 TRINITY_DN10270_c0_g1~~TRINITY_DN10270_c0_g1_i2.p1  ORF type:complete len:338 (-),score=65.75 TRINITY_DN10270_c0_g1_i2:126-1139(-)
MEAERVCVGVRGGDDDDDDVYGQGVAPAELAYRAGLDALNNVEGTIHEYELKWMLGKRPLVHNPHQLAIDYTPEVAQQMITAFTTPVLPTGGDALTLEAYLPCLAWHGVGTRWRQFRTWAQQHALTARKEQATDDAAPAAGQDPTELFRAFANHLGRVRSYRALALTEAQYATVTELNSIVPTGRLRVGSDTIDAIVREEGVKKILYARLYIGLGLLDYDPSLSLHDDPETAVSIASGYMELPTRRVYLMEMNVPKIEACGCKVQDVQSDPTRRWFKHNKIWYDAFLERTERYMLFEIPFYSQRCTKLTRFEDASQVLQFLRPYQLLQAQRKQLRPQ